MHRRRLFLGGWEQPGRCGSGWSDRCCPQEVGRQPGRGGQLPGTACQVATTVPWAGQSPERRGGGPHVISSFGICRQERRVVEAFLSRLWGPGDRPEQTPRRLWALHWVPAPLPTPDLSPTCLRPERHHKNPQGPRRAPHPASADPLVEAQHWEVLTDLSGL